MYLIHIVYNNAKYITVLQLLMAIGMTAVILFAIAFAFAVAAVAVYIHVSLVF